MGVSNEREEIKARVQQIQVSLPDGTAVPALGQGTWYMGENPQAKEQEIRALQLGIDLGMTLIDTAEMYAEGGAEQVTGDAIPSRRQDLFLVSKVYPHNAGIRKISESCENSLRRMGTEYLDLYLLHWRGNVPLSETIEGMEKLKKEGKILRWGVSNFDTEDMQELWGTDGGQNCAVNQVLYHIGSRGIEYDLLPWHKQHKVPVMAYSPLGHGGELRSKLMSNPVMTQIAEKYAVKPLQIALAWTIRTDNVIAIPKAVQENHVFQNAQAAAIKLKREDLEELDRAFPPPTHKVPLDII
ncbi:aldo/keto reductase [Peribacillus sp. SCS-155]|uniref:aldo/keto reductase n=1 Tax=Peribacillus sedimenti TaxID=3115297 RepID=UPI00390626D6